MGSTGVRYFVCRVCSLGCICGYLERDAGPTMKLRPYQETAADFLYERDRAMNEQNIQDLEDMIKELQERQE